MSSPNLTVTITADADISAEIAPPELPEVDTAFELILLEPSKVKLFRTGGSGVRATITDSQIGAERSYLRVQAARAFPLGDVDRFIGLRDDRDKDVGMLASLDGLDPDSRKILLEELNRRYFLPVIQHVKKIKEEWGTVTIEAETDKGDRTFYVQNLRESVQDLPPHRLLVTDRDGNRFEFPNTEQLDPKTMAIFQRVL